MAAVKCGICEVNEPIGMCYECQVSTCHNCTLPCDACRTTMCRDHVNMTSGGRTLCKTCMSDRNAKRRAYKAQKKRRQEEEEARELNTGPAYAGASFDALTGDGPSPPPKFAAQSATVGAARVPGAGGGTGLDDLKSDSDLLPEGYGKSDEEIAQEIFEAPVVSEALREERWKARGKKTFGYEGVPAEGSARLDLPKVDADRPILTGSGYQPPKRSSYLLASILFAISMMFFYNRSPYLGDLLWPFDTTTYEFNSDEMPQIQATNRLRNTSNISQLDIFSQGPIFLIAWAILITYVGGTIWITITTTRAWLYTRKVKRQEKKLEGKEVVDPFA